MLSDETSKPSSGVRWYSELVNQGNGPGLVIEAIQHMRAQQTGALELPSSWNALPTPTETETRFTKGMRGKSSKRPPTKPKGPYPELQ